MIPREHEMNRRGPAGVATERDRIEVTRAEKGVNRCAVLPQIPTWINQRQNRTQCPPRKLAVTESRQSICKSSCQSPGVALPSGLIQIKGRRGFYANITVPLKHRKTLGKSVIQKKAGDTLQEARQKLWEEQSKARDLFQRLEQETPEGQLRARFREWQQIEAEQKASGVEPNEWELSAEESLDLVIHEAIWPKADSTNPTKWRVNKDEEKLLKEAEALKKGLHHWEEWLSERRVTSGGVSPLVEKRWRTVLKSFVEWSKEQYPERVEKKTAAAYKRHLLTRTNKQGRTSKQSTVAKDIRDLSAAWKWATQHGFAKGNIWEGLARNLEVSKPRSLPDKNTIREADERAAAKTDLKYLIQRFTGCRKQGVCGLRRQDIDL